MKSVHIALLAGGRGTRFWPLSRRGKPKQLLDVTGEGAMLARTLERVAELAPADHVYAVTSADLASEVSALLALPKDRVLVEPEGRNTAAAIGLALTVAHARDPEAIVLALPSDHHVGRPDRLRALLRRGLAAARSQRAMVLLGIKPDRPATDYGYIVPGRATRRPAGLRQVTRFEEKPKVARATKLVESGALWNSGMFCLHAATALDEIARCMPALGRVLTDLARHVGKRSFRGAVRDAWPALPSVSFDVGVLERSKRVLVLPAPGLGWSDVGSWESLATLLPRDARGNATRGPAFLPESSRCLAVQSSPGRTLVTFNLDDVLLVDTGDVVLACPRGTDLRALVAHLERERPELL